MANRRMNNRYQLTRRSVLQVVVFGFALAIASLCARAADVIPPYLVGVWASDRAVLRGPYLFEGSAMYLGADGVGASVGGPPPIGMKIIATFDSKTNIVDFDAYEGSQRGPHGQVRYDPVNMVVSAEDGKTPPLRRRFDTFTDEMKRGLGLSTSHMDMVQPISTVSDPIQENFGARLTPYTGFLALPPESVPSGFKVVGHHYTKREYTLDFTKMVGSKKIDLNIVESDYTKFDNSNSELVQEFKYLGITGQVYVYCNQKTQETSFNLIWLNPPKQRIAIYLTQTPAKEYSPEDLIKILESMKNVQ